MEHLKRRIFQDHYHAKEFALLPILCNTCRIFFFSGQFRILLHESNMAYHHLKTISDLVIFSRRIYNDYRSCLLIQLFEGIPERGYGRTSALTANMYYRDWLHESREDWEPSFHHFQLVHSLAAHTDHWHLRRRISYRHLDVGECSSLKQLVHHPASMIHMVM